MPDQMNDDNGGRNSQNERRKKKRRGVGSSVKRFAELYTSTGEILGEGSFGLVKTYRNLITNKEYAVKVIEKQARKSRNKVLKEIEICHHCQGHPNVLQLNEYFEEDERFFVIFEKMECSLLKAIERRSYLTEQEASVVVKDVASALSFLHKKGIAHRDLKPENILCSSAVLLSPVKICDFDLGSGIHVSSRRTTPITTPELQSPVGSAEFMAPEVVDVWQDLAWSYDKRCDLWSLGIIMYILLCGYAPFYGNCGKGCGWEDGGACEFCQDVLFNCIKEGIYGFPDPEWIGISSDAKDLIRNLLVKNPLMRYSAEKVLQHPWITTKSSQVQLATPKVLQRNNSVRELQMFAENANALNRMIQHHMSISQVFHPPKTVCLESNEAEAEPEEEEDYKCGRGEGGGDGGGGVAFGIGVSDDEDGRDRIPVAAEENSTNDEPDFLNDSGFSSRESVGQ